MVQRSSTVLLCLCVCVMIALLPTAHAAPSASAATGPIYWGSYIAGRTYGYDDPPWDLRTIDTFENHAGKKIGILHWGQAWYSSQSWPYGYYPFVPALLDKVAARGSIPMVDWLAWDLAQANNPSQPNYQLADIINGTHDAYIREWATGAKNWNKPFFLRFNHEMNGDWYPWSEVRNGNSAGQYVQAWRHVHDIFRQVGATNVTWTWCPNTVYTGAIPLDRLYPGDAYVDWTCVDGYNWGTNPSQPRGWLSFRQVFEPTYRELQRIAPTKPIMIGETSSSQFGGSKAAWITDALATQLPQNFPNIKALVWFNWNTDGMDWVIESSPAAQTAFRDAIGSSYYAGNTFGALPRGTKVQPLTPVSGAPTPPTPTPTPPAGVASGALTIAEPLALDHPSVARGGTISGQVTYANNTTAPITIRTVVLAGRPPGGTNGGGPYLDFSPGNGAVTLAPGARVTLRASRTIGASDPLGTWYAFTSYQDNASVWHDAPGSLNRSFTVTAPTPTLARRTYLPAIRNK